MTARAALEKFWADDAFATDIRRKADYLNQRLGAIAESYGFRVKGRGMMRGIDTGSGDKAAEICAAAFERGLVIETAGSSDEIVKVLAPLTISDETFARGLDIVAEAFETVLRAPARVAAE